MNAIILAAGLGSRFGEITKKTHKALLPIGGVPNIERTIQCLIEFGINDINIVVGHLAENFAYLKVKYNCNLIYNSDYYKYNNLFSFYKAMEYFEDTYMIDADVVFLNNFLEQHNYSTYYIIDRNTNESEWIPILDKNGFVNEIDVNTYNSPSLLGVSFWKKEDCILIKQKVIELISNKDDLHFIQNKYWDDIPKDLIPNIKVLTKKLNIYDAGEMDNIENYIQLQNLYSENL
ncbi:NTP transferase domain-containing protein [Providencia rettgeri]|uniref:NTP transferase domain-containing protein n=1 Tax=Providencia TaxID=586 RepID=UPI0027FDC6FF|nr:NTP transferase domain-containing protein [Providencia stuartii]ELR5132695.1 NTP transferase domain-containing protein [Providencia rettgeri]MDQ5992339.1 NTP transferase domain-containing protein [Providencia stuartii]